MPNNFTGRIWKIVEDGETPFGTANVKFKGGIWSGATAATIFTITDVDGRVYTFKTDAAGATTNFYEMGWLSGPLTFGFSPSASGEVDLFLGTR